MLICVGFVKRKPRVPGSKSSLNAQHLPCWGWGMTDTAHLLPVSGCCHKLGGSVWECPTETQAFWKGIWNLH